MGEARPELNYRYKRPLPSFEAQLRFEDVEKHRALFELPEPGTLSLRYRWEFPAGKKTRQRLRARLIPDFEFGRFTARAEVDFIKIGFRAEGHVFRAQLANRLREGCGCPVSIARSKHYGKTGGHTARLQRPSRKTVETLVRLLEAQPGLSCSGKIEEIELSVDWYAEDATDAERWLMTELLWRHLLPDEKYWHFLCGYPRCSWGEGAKHLLTVPTEAAVRRRKKAEPERWGVALDDNPARDAALNLGNYTQPATNGTIYYGPKNGGAGAGEDLGVSFRVMHKTIDDQNRKTGEHKILELHERRVRIEVTLSGKGLDKVGISRLEDLSAGITRVRKEMFRFYLPTIPYGGTKPASAKALASTLLAPKYLPYFIRAGVFGVAMYEWGCRERILAFNARRDPWEHARADASHLADTVGQRFRKFATLNERARKALTRLAEKWE